jgi:hypothetical protein
LWVLPQPLQQRCHSSCPHSASSPFSPAPTLVLWAELRPSSSASPGSTPVAPPPSSRHGGRCADSQARRANGSGALFAPPPPTACGGWRPLFPCSAAPPLLRGRRSPAAPSSPWRGWLRLGSGGGTASHQPPAALVPGGGGEGAARGEAGPAAGTTADAQLLSRFAARGRPGERRERKTGAERLRPSNFDGRSEPTSCRYITSGAAPLPPLSNQTHGYPDAEFVRLISPGSTKISPSEFIFLRTDTTATEWQPIHCLFSHDYLSYKLDTHLNSQRTPT